MSNVKVKSSLKEQACDPPIFTLLYFLDFWMEPSSMKVEHAQLSNTSRYKDFQCFPLMLSSQGSQVQIFGCYTHITYISQLTRSCQKEWYMQVSIVKLGQSTQCSTVNATTEIPLMADIRGFPLVLIAQQSEECQTLFINA